MLHSTSHPASLKAFFQKAGIKGKYQIVFYLKSTAVEKKEKYSAQGF
jgi:hypothetical protein